MVEALSPALDTTITRDGLRLDPRTPLPAPARCVGDWLVHWARVRPHATFLAERSDQHGTGWRRLDYARTLHAVEGIASALLERGGDPTRPVMILSENSVDAALVTLAAMHAGIPAAHVSAAYSLLSSSFERLRAVAGQLRPGFLFADDPARFAAPLAALAPHGATLLDSATVDALSRTTPSLQRFTTLRPDTVAKVLFTSGSTNAPRGVVNTQRMLTSNQESIAACWPFLAQHPPTVVDWLPWSHTFGGNHNFFMVLKHGGSLHVDRGRPLPGLIETTLDNLSDVGPDLWFNVPRGFDQAVTLLEQDHARAASVFRNLRVIFYAAAALSARTRERLERLAADLGHDDIFFTSAWGLTETSPLATSAHFPTRTTGILGVPAPGVSLKLVRVPELADRFELRVKGPNVSPGLWQPGGGLSPLAVDDEGYLPTGDAGRLADEARPEAGVVFAGRLGENFKLSSGTWVQVAAVRIAVVDALSPLVLDAVVAGHDREAPGLLLFLTPAGRALAPDELRERLLTALAGHNRAHPAGSERIARALVAAEPLSLDAGETTDKGYTNQRRVLERRAADVAALFADPPPATVLVPP